MRLIAGEENPIHLEDLTSIRDDHTGVKGNNFQPSSLRSMANKWAALLASGGLLWGLNFYYDLPASLSTPLQTHLGYSDEDYAYLFSTFYIVYSVPNIVLPLLSGFAVQRYGERRIWILCITSVLSGQVAFAIGVQLKRELFLVGGRVFLGLGGEISTVLASELVTRHFQHDKLALGLAAFMMIAISGTISNTFITPRLAHSSGVVAASWITSMTCLIVCGFSVYKILSMDPKSFKDYRPSKVNVLGLLKRMPPQYWQLCVICVLAYGSIGPFNNSAQQFLAATFYDGDQTISGSVVGITHIISGTFTLPFGWLLEQPRFKKTPISLVISSAVLLAAHLLFLMQSFGPLIPISLLGVGNGLFGVAFWPFVASVILHRALPEPGRYAPLRQPFASDDHELRPYSLADQDHDLDNQEMGTGKNNESLLVVGYGIMTSLLNLSIAVMPAILAVVQTIAGYMGLETVFVALTIAGVFASVRLITIWK